MEKSANVGEMEIGHTILELMKDGRVWSNADLKGRLKPLLPWSDYDKERAPKRPHEFRWENRVNNALRQKSIRSSLYGQGYVKNVGHGLHQITEEGRQFVTGDFDLN
jgi:hypothetical protein